MTLSVPPDDIGYDLEEGPRTALKYHPPRPSGYTFSGLAGISASSVRTISSHQVLTVTPSSIPPQRSELAFVVGLPRFELGTF
jgi:hypothetical protein